MNVSHYPIIIRCCDHCDILLIVAEHCEEKYPDSIMTEIFVTFSQIQAILYLPDNQRSCQYVLQLYALTFKHAMLLCQIIKTCNKLTSRKLYGKYYHSVIHHLPNQYRIVSGSSTNAENEERQFKFIGKTADDTSNHHPDNVISNAIIRSEVKRNEKDDEGDVKEKKPNKRISDLYKNITMKLSNSCIPFKLIEDRCKDYQLFLERIADYLVDSTFWRENDFGVEFLDVEPVDHEKRLHHFRSRTIKQEMKEVSEIWNTVCIPNYTTLVPALKLYIEQDDGINVIYPGTLNYFKYRHDVTTNIGEEFIDRSDSTLQDMPAVPKSSTPKSSPNKTLADDNCCIDFNINMSNNASAIMQSSTSFVEQVLLHSPDLNMEEEDVIHDLKTDEEVLIIKKVIPPPPKSKNKDLGKSSMRLEFIFDGNESELIREHDTKRKLYKKYPRDRRCREEYEYTVAQIEVKLSLKKLECEGNMRSIEMNELKNNKSLSLIPTNPDLKERYHHIIKVLDAIQNVKKELGL